MYEETILKYGLCFSTGKALKSKRHTHTSAFFMGFDYLKSSEVVKKTLGKAELQKVFRKGDLPLPHADVSLFNSLYSKGVE